MNKKLIWAIMWGCFLMSSTWSVFAYSIWSPIQYVKQLYVTPTWNSNSSAATIKLDGANGRLDAKTIYENGDEVATRNELNSVKNNLKQLINKADKIKEDAWIKKYCNVTDLWYYNPKTKKVCTPRRVTSDVHCLEEKNDNVTRKQRLSDEQWKIEDTKKTFRCLNGEIRRREDVYQRENWISRIQQWVVIRVVGFTTVGYRWK